MDESRTRCHPSPDFLLQLTSHQSALYGSIAALLGGVEGAQDVLQETNRALLEKAAEYEPGRPFVAWALTFARFQVLAWRKRQSRDRLVLDDDMLALLADRLTTASMNANPRLDALERCLQKLAPEARQLVDARYVREESVSTIAARQGVSINALSVTLFRIRKALRECVRTALAVVGEG
jgi:RNA polymerase sigma-70 factor (ECF subfamily)